MWSYYELTTAQVQADRRTSAGYSVSPAAAREFPKIAIDRALNEQRQSVKIQEQAARKMAIKVLYGAIRAFFRRTAAVARSERKRRDTSTGRYLSVLVCRYVRF